MIKSYFLVGENMDSFLDLTEGPLTQSFSNAVAANDRPTIRCLLCCNNLRLCWQLVGYVMV